MATLPDLPAWITNQELVEDERLEDHIIVLVPPAKLITKEPESDLLKKFNPGNKWYWFSCRKENEEIVPRLELVDTYTGLPKEAQDDLTDLIYIPGTNTSKN